VYIGAFLDKVCTQLSEPCINNLLRPSSQVKRPRLSPSLHTMSLFTGNLRRSVGAGLISAFTGTLLMWTLPSNLHAFTLAQTSVAILAIGTLMIFIVTHHRRNGQVLTQDQEEMILIGAFGLFWFAFLVALRAMWQRRSADGELGINGLPAPRRQAGFTGNNKGRYKTWPCSRYDVDCVVEEWSYY